MQRHKQVWKFSWRNWKLFEVKEIWENQTNSRIEIYQELFYLCFIDYAKAFDCVDHNKLWKILQEMGMTLPASWEICMQVKKYQLELDME